MQTSAMPSGYLMVWDDRPIPVGWALCDGSKVTLSNGVRMVTPSFPEGTYIIKL